MTQELPDRVHYRLIADQLRTSIANQALPAGDFLPSRGRAARRVRVGPATIGEAWTCCTPRA